MKRFAWGVVCLLVITACTAPAAATLPSPSPSVAPSQAPTQMSPVTIPSATPTRMPTVTDVLPSATAASTNTAAPIPFQICSPLQDITLAELPSILTTPFKAPSPGRDNGHHGVDFAYYQRGSHTEMLGLPVYSVLPGTVAAVINDRTPYGNAIIIETPLDNIPADFLQGLDLQFQPTPAVLDGRLTCPTLAAPPGWMPGTEGSTQSPGSMPSTPTGTHPSTGSTPSTPTGTYPSTGSTPSTPTLADHDSLYILYSHFKDAPTLAVGDAVACGEVIGAVGNTGNSGNPHLHLETRFGPGGATFTSMSHYNNLATAEEMSNYCTWRISGVFQIFDPMIFFNLAINYPYH